MLAKHIQRIDLPITNRLHEQESDISPKDMNASPGNAALNKKSINRACLLSGLLALGFLLISLCFNSTRLGYNCQLAASAWLGVLFGLLLVRSGPLELSGTGPMTVAEFGLIVACGAFLALLAYWCGMHQFETFNLSVLIDFAWRLINGQKPYVDFPCTFPVGFYLGAEYAFRLFGVYWRSIVAFNAIWAGVCFLWLYTLLRSIMQNRLLAFWCALACAADTLVAAAIWWYNPVTNIFATIYAASVVAVILSPRAWPRWISLCLSLFLIALMKPNVAAPLILFGSICLFAFRPTRWQVVAASMVSLALWLLAIHLHNSTIQQVLAAYLSVGTRVLGLSHMFFEGLHWPAKITKVILLFVVCVPWIVRLHPRFSRPRPNLPLIAFLVGCIVVGLFGASTNADLPVTHLPLLLLAGILIVGSEAAGARRFTLSDGWTKYFTVLCVFLAFDGLSEAVARDDVRGDFFEFRLSSEPFSVPFFKGLHTGPTFHRVVDLISGLCRSEDMSHAYFGNQLEWAYAAFDLQSPKGQPVQWDPAHFPSADQSMYVDRWIADNFNPVLIMYLGALSQQHRDAIADRYILRSQIDFHLPYVTPLHVFALRGQAGAVRAESPR
jgi:hypothetical protein